MHFCAISVSSPHTQPVRAWGVVAGVLLLHGLVLWAVHVGLRPELQAPKPVVVAARLILPPTTTTTETTSPAPSPTPNKTPALVAPLPPPAQPTPKPLAGPQAITPAPTPAPAPPAPAPPVLAVAASAAPAFTAPPAPVAAPAPATTGAPGVTSTPAASSASAGLASVGASPSAARGSTARVSAAAELDPSATCTEPAYPALSRRFNEAGTVQLKLYIGVDGRVLESHTERSSGFERLDEAARAAFARCLFKPGTVDGKPAPSWLNKEYRWRLG